jgi:23S rRNA pseudoU1915 N3-methylase RlmH
VQFWATKLIEIQLEDGSKLVGQFPEMGKNYLLSQLEHYSSSLKDVVKDNIKDIKDVKDLAKSVEVTGSEKVECQSKEEGAEAIEVAKQSVEKQSVEVAKQSDEMRQILMGYLKICVDSPSGVISPENMERAKQLIELIKLC